MNAFIIMLLVFGIVSYIKKEKLKEEQRRKKAAQAVSASRLLDEEPDEPMHARPRPSANPRLGDFVFPGIGPSEIEAKRQEHAKRAEELAIRRQELLRRRQRAGAAEVSRRNVAAAQVKERLEPEPRSGLSSRLIADRVQQTLVPEDCCEVSLARSTADKRSDILPLGWSRDSLIQGIVISEVLGKPKALRGR